LIEELDAQAQRVEAQARQLVIENDQLKNQNVRLRSQLEQQRYPYMIRSMVAPLSASSVGTHFEGVCCCGFGQSCPDNPAALGIMTQNEVRDRLTGLERQLEDLERRFHRAQDDSITASFGTTAAIYRGQRPTPGPPAETEADAISRKTRINFSY
jgi:hypothetical protein